MRQIRIDPANMPTDTPAMIGTRYYCREWDCYHDRAELVECGAIPSTQAYYTPILRCSECGRLYFGNPTPIAPAEDRPAEPERKPAPQPEEKKIGDIILPQLLTV